MACKNNAFGLQCGKRYILRSAGINNMLASCYIMVVNWGVNSFHKVCDWMWLRIVCSRLTNRTKSSPFSEWLPDGKHSYSKVNILSSSYTKPISGLLITDLSVCPVVWKHCHPLSMKLACPWPRLVCLPSSPLMTSTGPACWLLYLTDLGILILPLSQAPLLWNQLW